LLAAPNEDARKRGRRVTSLVAWRILMFDKGRNALATGGIFIAIVMIFLQLGFYYSVPMAGMLVYDHLRFDILLTSSDYVFQEQSYDFPRQRLKQALSIAGVATASPFYQGETQWLNPEMGVRRNVYVMGYKLADDSFRVGDVERQRPVLQRRDTALVDTQTLPIYGPLEPGRRVEIGDRTVEIGGRYVLGTGFLGLGAVVTSDLNFIRIFPDQSLDDVNLGLLTLKPGSNPDKVAADLRALLPADTQVFTRAEIDAYEQAFWRMRTSTGLVFGFGVIVSIVVGMVILYQALTTQVTRQLPQYATLKAMGYTDGYLQQIVVAVALMTACIPFLPAWGAAIMAYDKVRMMARLPIEMTGTRVVIVLVITVVMSAATALIAVRKVHRADPADLF
jgi:putative ABC transport system permease protein